MKKSRLEAFSDGVIAIIITIMVLEIKAPEAPSWEGLYKIIPTLLGYLLSFVFVGIYWNNHHHLLSVAHKINAPIMWTNLNLLFWLSLVPFATKWMNETHFSRTPIIAYALLLELNGLSYFLLSNAISKTLQNDTLRLAIKLNFKSYLSIIMYAIAIPVAYYSTAVSIGCFAFVSMMWIVPSKKIENSIESLMLSEKD